MLNILSTMSDNSVLTSTDEIMPFFVIILYVIIFGAMFGYLFVLWLFKAISVFKMSKKLNLNMPWIGFVPYVLPFAYGRIAEQYNGKVLKKPLKFSILLLILQFVPGVVIGAFYVVLFGVAFASFAISAAIGIEMLAIIPIMIVYFIMFFIMMASTFVVNFFNYLACWNVFAIFGGEKNVLYFILSITLGIEPFILFALRNKEPQNLKEEIELVEEN